MSKIRRRTKFSSRVRRLGRRTYLLDYQERSLDYYATTRRVRRVSQIYSFDEGIRVGDQTQAFWSAKLARRPHFGHLAKWPYVGDDIRKVKVGLSPESSLIFFPTGIESALRGLTILTRQ